MMREQARNGRTIGFVGSLVMHVLLVSLALTFAPQVRDFVQGDDSPGRGTSGADAAPFVRNGQVGGPPTTRLRQVLSGMSASGRERQHAVRVRLAIERVIDHLWQSTAFAMVVGLLTLALRRNRARVRYALWFAASVKFFVPLALLIALGQLVWPASIGNLADHPFVAEISAPFANAGKSAMWPASTALDSSGRDWRSVALIAIWLCGFAAIAVIRFRQWRRLQALVESSTPMVLAGVNVPDSVEVRSAEGLLEPGVVGWQPPVLLMPADLDRHLTTAETEAIVAHELCHVRRRDNLTAAIHMIVEAVFWFHPIVWWIGRRLVDERERACDEHVLRTVGEPRSYAQGIVNVCKRYVESPLTCVSGVSSASVRKRVDAILANRVGEAIGPLKKVTLAVTIALVVIVPLGVGAVNAPWLQGGAPPLASMPTAFRAASSNAAPRPPVTLALVAVRPDGALGPKLRRSPKSDADCAAAAATARPCGGEISDYRIAADGITLPELTALLASAMPVQVTLVDRTGLTGRFHVDLTWTPGPGKGSTLVPSMREQLGLTFRSIDDLPSTTPQ